MIDPASFTNVRLHGGFVIGDSQFSNVRIVDAVEREAVAQIRINGREFRLMIRAGLNDRRELATARQH